ncbi:zinc-dependent alcohol dehydrogenase family protein [Deinococcus peraridilitoris]|uniref:Zn-dependent alcohol dehydrogenase, class III n=1 Tax=Deinococcus peraridilitoris (strain DSM 19664 / LMG 22246 / CIP 109416 / KR-200) TaxID=937777 RepID=K9ZY90_DEIPD|nr:zinc-dependent alcohol dehydrogenase family protein [Deinococcus peraridilitoris]AFZ65715.1 Zn-dependent alcohol dehydrogenase, class III [Deinococcus peraridilitoris DSM 19664]
MLTTAAVLRFMGTPGPYATSRPLSIETVRLDPPGEGEVLVEVAAAGLCHSDLSVIEGVRPRPLPMLLGHEASGVVVSIGPGVRSVAAGDHVVCTFVPSCGHCLPCATGRPALCEPGAQANAAGTLLSGVRRIRTDDGPLHHHLGVSGFARHAVLSERSVVRIDPDVPLREAALFGCAVLTGVGAVMNTARIEPGMSAAIFGLGGVGLSAVMGAVASGAHPVIAVDVVEAKLDLARQMGATHVVHAAQDDPVHAIRELTGGGAQHVVETVGSERVLVQAYQATRRGGTTTTVGLPAPDRAFSIPAVSLVAEERTVKGSYMGSTVPSRDIPRFIALWEAGRLPVERLLTGTLALQDINAGFDALAAGQAVRQLVTFE